MAVRFEGTSVGVGLFSREAIVGPSAAVVGAAACAAAGAICTDVKTSTRLVATLMARESRRVRTRRPTEILTRIPLIFRSVCAHRSLFGPLPWVPAPPHSGRRTNTTRSSGARVGESTRSRRDARLGRLSRRRTPSVPCRQRPGRRPRQHRLAVGASIRSRRVRMKLEPPSGRFDRSFYSSGTGDRSVAARSEYRLDRRMVWLARASAPRRIIRPLILQNREGQARPRSHRPRSVRASDPARFACPFPS